MIVIEDANLELGDLVAYRVNLERVAIVIGVAQWISSPANVTYFISEGGDRTEVYEAELVRVVRTGKAVNVAQMSDTEGITSTPPDGEHEEDA